MTTPNNEPEYEIVDPVTEKPVEDKSKKAAPPVKEPEKQVKPDESFEIPEKFKGKSPAEIAKAYEEQEKLMGRQAQELGEMRKSVNDLIQRELEEAKSSKEAVKMEESLEYGDLVDDPENSIRKVVSKDLNSIKEELNQFKTQAKADQFAAKYPNYLEIAQSIEFQGWVSESPYRTRMYYAADKGDFTAAEELFGEYTRRTAKATATPDNLDRDKALKGASLESGSATGSAKRKMYRRSDIINLRLRDPDTYNAKSAEINKAYVEGRVIDDIT